LHGRWQEMIVVAMREVPAFAARHNHGEGDMEVGEQIGGRAAFVVHLV